MSRFHLYLWIIGRLRLAPHEAGVCRRADFNPTGPYDASSSQQGGAAASAADTQFTLLSAELSRTNQLSLAESGQTRPASRYLAEGRASLVK